MDASVPVDGASPPVVGKLAYPVATQPMRLYRSHSLTLTLLHLVALLALIPYFFSWTGLLVAVGSHLTFGMLGISVGYHRLLTHQGFTCAKWFEHLLAILGVCTFQDSPARWVAIHRIHHQHSDEQQDPHSPAAGFLWGHMGWLFFRSRDHENVIGFERFVRDLLKDPFYLRLERNQLWMVVFAIHALLLTLAGFVGAWLYAGTLSASTQMAASILVWGVALRTVLILHGTWAVNSVGHVWGYRTYDTDDNSRNNPLIALVSHGEGWHNNHHADQRSAAHGHRWWEFDMAWCTIQILEWMGIAKNVVRPRAWTGPTA